MDNNYIEIKNLFIINLNEISKSSYLLTVNYITSNKIENKNDILALYKHFFYLDFLETYSKNKKQHVLLFYNDDQNTVYYPKGSNIVIKFLKNKLKFPTLISNISLEDYISMISFDSPEYDEAINNNFSLIDTFKQLKNYLKQSGLLHLTIKYDMLDEELRLLLQSKSNTK